MKNVFWGIIVGILMITLIIGCPTPSSANGVQISPSEHSFYVTGRPVDFLATSSPGGAADTTVIWTSSDHSVATVSSNGRVTGVGSGTAVITATTSDGHSATATVSVPHPSVDTLVASSVAWLPDGSIWTWGSDSDGILGNGDANGDVTVPTQIASERLWRAVNAGSGAIMAIALDGTLWGWGTNTYGNLGTGDTDDREAPVQIGTDDDWAQVQLSGAYANAGLENKHGLAIKTDGTLWAWGNNENAQLGDGTDTARLSPIQIGTDSDWSMIAAAWETSYALKENGSLYAWGADWAHASYQGMLGDGGADSDDDVASTPTLVGSANEWAFVSAQNKHVLAIKTDGTLWGWGANGSNELSTSPGTDDFYPNIVQIGTDTDWVLAEAGFERSAAIKSDGTLWVWGWFTEDYYGLGYESMDGEDEVNIEVPTKVDNNSDWVDVSLGGDHGLGVRRSEKVLGWGYNDNGQVGNNLANAPQESAVQLQFN